MASHRLLLGVRGRDLRRLPTTDFVWRPPPEKSSFRTDIGPRLSECGTTPRRNVEFLRLAVLAFLADRTTPRPDGSWTRHLELQVPVWDSDSWEAVAPDLEQLLGFLTYDRWSIVFVPSRTPKGGSVQPAPQGPAAALFSGGADSLAGALLGADRLGEPPILISHHDWSITRGYQKNLISELGKMWGQEPPTFSARVGRSERQIGSGSEFGKETTSRARSLLFIALGLAAAGAAGVPLRIPENGFASLNPPMGGERIGALSTRTTHPWYLSELSRILESVGAHCQIENPHADRTKGEIFKEVAALLGTREASRLLSASHSCARGNMRFAGAPGVSHCGVCFGCLVRRAAFRHSGAADLTAYLIEDFNTRIGAYNGWYSENRRRDLQAARYAAARGIDPSEVTLNLPANADAQAAIGVARRGLDELAALVL